MVVMIYENINRCLSRHLGTRLKQVMKPVRFIEFLRLAAVGAVPCGQSCLARNVRCVGHSVLDSF
jgi:hypothetical protein